MQISFLDGKEKNVSYYGRVLESISSYSVEHTSLRDLIAVIIGSSAKPEMCEQIAALTHTRISNLTAKELEKEFEVTPTAAVRLAASFRLLSKVKVANDQIDSPETAANHLSFIKNNEEESFVVLHLDTKNKVTKKETISTGTINSSIVHPREVFKSAIRESTASIILGHNHPSGIVDPSHEDIQTTRRLVDAGELLGIRVLDHIIVAGDKHLSLKERGHM